MRTATIFAVITHPEQAASDTSSATWLEWRADQAGEPQMEQLPSRFRDSVLYSLSADSYKDLHRRTPRLATAATRFPMVELEASRDLVPEILQKIPAAQRFITWRGPVTCKAELAEAVRRCGSVPARWYRLEAKVPDQITALMAMKFSKDAKRDDLMIHADGWHGSWTRVLAPHWGAPLVFGSPENAFTEPGLFPISRLVRDFDLPHLHPLEGLSGIVGGSVHGSLSPAIHNHGYRQSGLPMLFLPFQTSSFSDFAAMIDSRILADLGLETPGFVVVAPHKTDLLQWADQCDGDARACEGGNVLLLRDSLRLASTTDISGMVRVMETEIARNRKVAVIGCGGAGRGATAAFERMESAVTLFNRNPETGRKTAQKLGVAFRPLEDFRAADFQIIVHATPLGKKGEEPPFSVEEAAPGAVLVEYVYGRRRTRLVERGRQRGLTVISGHQMLQAQASLQFKQITGHPLSNESLALIGPHDRHNLMV